MKHAPLRVNAHCGQVALFLTKKAAGDFAIAHGWARRDVRLVRWRFQQSWHVGQPLNVEGRWRFLNDDGSWTDVQAE